jgi:spermidine/putrescine transport system ATP-binding protein
MGVAIQYVVETPGGEELTAISQNRAPWEEPEGIGPGSEVLLTWDPRHTFIVARDQPDQQPEKEEVNA